ncbi:MAG: hypothetical protein JWO05_2237 [Gemmatimonadetes bacterium]|nr:hypothetical protein [Gemmatimonadota bacterium]
MSFLGRWRAERVLQRRAGSFVDVLLHDPQADDVEWLSQVATRGDVDHARWELRYARRALGLLAAQRDALDDRTASLVAHTLAGAFGRDPNIAPDALELAERQFNARLSAYRDALAARAGAQVSARLGQTVLAFSGGSFRDADQHVKRGGALLGSYLTEANSALREIFGIARLPDDVAPSAIAAIR